MTIYLGTDHAGFALKEHLKAFLEGQGYEVIDRGAHEFEASDDYPDFIKLAARGVATAPHAFGFVFGKSGMGECIVANKVRNIRCALGINEENVKLAREHNNANMLSLGSAFVSNTDAEKLALLFLTTPFSEEERHARRIKKITQIELEEAGE